MEVSLPRNLIKIYFIALIATLLTVAVIFSGKLQPLNRVAEVCWIDGFKKGEPNNLVLKWLSQFRGKNYWLTPERTPQRYCLVTSWALTHIALYAIIGYFFPKFFWQTFAIGVTFEIGEWITLDCHDILDVLWNSIGFGIGATLLALRF